MPGIRSDRTSRTTSCTVQRSDGRFCDAPSAEDVPFPICGRHALKLYRHMRDLVLEAFEDDGVKATIALEILRDGQREAKRKIERHADRKHFVYYLRVGELIKIGTTGNLRQRLNQYPPGTKVLATEPGGRDVEDLRLEQFAHLLVSGKEWFKPGPDLTKHINQIRRANGGIMPR